MMRTSMTHVVALIAASAAAVSGCECGADVVPDSGLLDASADARIDVDAGVAPGPSCADALERPGTACVQGSWFRLAMWSTARVESIPLAEPAPERRVYLDSYQIDQREVSNAEYLAFLVETGADAPPARCGYEDREELRVPPAFGPMIPEVSGWSAEAPASDLDDHPVVCVTRAEARAFCENRGGRLPTAIEYMKAAVDAEGEPMRFPWGDEPPPDMSGAGPVGLAERLVFYEYVPGESSLGTEPVTSGRELGASTFGVFDLAGNVSELLETCEEDLTSYEGETPIVRPSSPTRDACATGVLVAGSNWRSWTNEDGGQTIGSPSVFRFVRGAIEYVGENVFPRETFFSPWTQPIAGEAGDDPAGNDRRSWRVGFRCAYDVE